MSKSEAHISLDEKDFHERQMINKKKQWILEGLDPDEEEKKLLDARKKKAKEFRKKRKQRKKEQAEKVDKNNQNNR